MEDDKLEETEEEEKHQSQEFRIWLILLVLIICSVVIPIIGYSTGVDKFVKNVSSMGDIGSLIVRSIVTAAGIVVVTSIVAFESKK